MKSARDLESATVEIYGHRLAICNQSASRSEHAESRAGRSNTAGATVRSWTYVDVAGIPVKDLCLENCYEWRSLRRALCALIYETE